VDRSGEGSHGILVEGLTEHKNSISPETSRFLRGVSDADLVEALLLVRMSREAENDHFVSIGYEKTIEQLAATFRADWLMFTRSGDDRMYCPSS